MSENGKEKDRNLFIIAGLVILAVAVYRRLEHYKKCRKKQPIVGSCRTVSVQVCRAGGCW